MISRVRENSELVMKFTQMVQLHCAGENKSTKRHMGSNDSAQLRHGSLIARSNLSGES